MKGISSPTSTSSGPSTLSPFDFHPLGRVLFGSGTLARLSEAVRSVGGTRVLLVTDPGLEHVGHPQRAAKLLTDAGLHVAVFDGVKENPTEREVNAGVVAAVVSPTMARIVRLSDGMGWDIPTEPGLELAVPLWINDDSAWFILSKPHPIATSARSHSGAVRIKRSSLGPPTVPNGI